MKTENPDRSKNIVLFGPESSGKTTLCKELAGNFGGLWVPEYLRQFCESKAGLPGFEDMPEIFEGQRQIEAEFQESNPAILFFDTNPLQLMVYHQFYFGTGTSDEKAHFSPLNYDLYLLCAPDIIWEKDPFRDMPEKRMELFELFQSELDNRGLPYRTISGNGQARTESAIDAVQDFFGL